MSQLAMPGSVGIFVIQTSAPRELNVALDEAETLEAAIEDVFPLLTEDAYLCWNAVRVPLSYKYDVSAMAEDIIEIVGALLACESGTIDVAWASSTFRSDWRLIWGQGVLNCSAQWTSCAGRVEELLNAAGPIELPVKAFVAEWGSLLQVVLHALNRNGTLPPVVIRDLVSICRQLKEPGALYRG